MSETGIEAGTSSDDSNNGGSNNSGWTPPASQEELNRVITERVKREREKFADYNDLKAKAAQLAKIEEANSTEAERAAKRIAEAEQTVAKVPSMVAEALRTHLIALHNIPAERAELFLTASDPDLLLKQVAELVKDAGDRKKSGNFVPREGHTPTQSDSEGAAVARQLFGS